MSLVGLELLDLSHNKIEVRAAWEAAFWLSTGSIPAQCEAPGRTHVLAWLALTLNTTSARF